MTRVTIEHSDGRWRIAARGHATGAPEACAGVSALLYALAGWLKNAPETARRARCRLAPGDAELRFPGSPAADAAAALCAIGLAQIAKRCPAAVAVCAAPEGFDSDSGGEDSVVMVDGKHHEAGTRGRKRKPA